MKKINGTMMQYFEWYLSCDFKLWNKAKQEAEKLSKQGITSLWLPPAYKAAGGKNDTGYAVYDVYDLGEFDQKGSRTTKYGTKDEYTYAIKIIRQNNIDVYADIVLNHKMGADGLQIIPASKFDWDDHNKEISGEQTIKAPTKFVFPGRNHKYSDFEWNWTHFDGVDVDCNTGEMAIFKFKDKQWQQYVDEEHDNYDFLMGADLDFSNPEVVKECTDWGKWYLKETNVDGFRLDAVKHIDAGFYKQWLKDMREESKKNLFAVGEYWSYDVSKLHRYIQETDGEISLFDAPLHWNFYNASKNQNYNMGGILDHTLMKENPSLAVTFVDNHDTQPGQALTSFVESWFKKIAYSIILLRNEGYPCIFYGDYYGIVHDNIEKEETLETLMMLRKDKSYGKQNDYFDHQNVIGWTREGDDEHLKSGLAVVASNSFDAEKRMYIGPKFAGEVFIDSLGICEDEIPIDEEGFGVFKCKGRSASVWVEK